MKMYTWAQVATAAKPTPQTCARERHTNHGVVFHGNMNHGLPPLRSLRLKLAPVVG